MKELIIGKCINYIQRKTNYDKIKIKEIKYGLESIYLTLTKAVVIFLIALLLGIFKEMIIYLIIYNILRMPSFGLHASKTWICLVSSIIIFILIPYICINVTINIVVKSIICILGIYFMYKNSPADTKKRPIVSKNRREKYKFISVIITIIYAFISILIKNNFLSNCFMFGIVLQNLMISPIIYRIFKLPYNNYINYIKNHPEIEI